MTSRTALISASLLCAVTLYGASLPLAAQGKSSAQKIYPLIDATTGYLLGGSSGPGKWVLPDKARGTVKSGNTYRLYSPFKRLATVVGGAAEHADGPCEDTLFVKLTQTGAKKGVLEVPLRMPSEKQPVNEPSMATNTPWNALPRIPVVLNAKGSVYTAAVTNFLAKKGIKTTAEIKQIWRVDLEGDGTNEVLITATRHRGANAGQFVGTNSKAGDYSVVLLRKVVKGKVVTIPLDEEYHLKSTTFSAPTVFGLAAVLDLDGDGKMEVLTRGRYYEGDWISMYQITPKMLASTAATKPVLTIGCGA